MARSKSDISNSALRIFLQKVGKFYDTERGYEPFIPKKAQKLELLEHFNFECCYCGDDIDVKSLSQDHLIPMNKISLGLHSWGNVVPCCNDCNNKKNQKPWKDYLKTTASVKLFIKRQKRIDDFVSKMKYDPNLNLSKYANNLYEDIGEVAMTLISLRYKQAEEDIKILLSN